MRECSGWPETASGTGKDCEVLTRDGVCWIRVEDAGNAEKALRL